MVANARRRTPSQAGLRAQAARVLGERNGCVKRGDTGNEDTSQRRRRSRAEHGKGEQGRRRSPPTRRSRLVLPCACRPVPLPHSTAPAGALLFACCAAGMVAHLHELGLVGS